MAQRHGALSLSLLCCLALGAPLASVQSADAQASAPSPAQAVEQLRSRLSELIAKSELGDHMGVVVADARGGERLFTLSPTTPRNPASNMKLVTAATALVALGAEHRLRTTLAGSLGPDGRVGRLVLRGEGDPSLSFEDLLAMAGRLVDYGVRSVDEVVVDGSYFDERVLPPAYEQQPREIAAFRAPVSAVAVDRNAFELRVAPGPAVDQPARVGLRCPDYFALEASVRTSAGGSPSIGAEQKPSGDRLGLRVTGSMPITVRGVGYERRVESPLSYAGHCLRAALKVRGIEGALTLSAGARERGEPILVTRESAPLSVLLQRVGKWSDNFYAEMLLKVIGRESNGQPGSSAAGLVRAKALLAAAGAPPEAATLVNGSGLFKGGAITPDALVSVLSHLYRDPSLRSEYVSQLAIAGKDGTLATRLTDLKQPRVVRAKTGTLDDVVALSGYVLGPNDRTLAFSILVNGISGRQWMGRDLADNLVRALVAYVYP